MKKMIGGSSDESHRPVFLRSRRRWAGIALAAGMIATGSPVAAQVTKAEKLSQSSTATNSGFGFGARALGMGGAFIAIADDASAASWNPAGIGQLTRPEITIVGSSSTTSVAASPEDQLWEAANAKGVKSGAIDRLHFTGWDATSRSSGIDFASYVQPFTIGSTTVSAQLSYARVLTAGSSSHSNSLVWTDNYYANPPAEVLYSQSNIHSESSGSGAIDTYTLGFATALLNQKLFVGASATLWRGEIGSVSYDTEATTYYEYKELVPGQGVQAIPTSTYLWEVTETERRKVNGLSGSFGVLALPLPWLRVGAVYRTGWSGSGTAQGTYYRLLNSTEGRSTRQGATSFDSKVEWPSSYGFGIAVQPVSTLTVSFDYTGSDWRKGRTDKTVASWTTYTDGSATPNYGEASFPATGLPAGWQNNQNAVRVGAEYVLRAGKALIPIRAGYYSITAMAPLFGGTYDTDPKMRFNGITGGVGISLDLGGERSLLFDLAIVSEEAESSYSASQQFFPDGDTSTYYSDQWSQKVRNSRLIGSLVYRF